MKQKAFFLLFISFTLATVGSVMLSSCFPLEDDVYICDIHFDAQYYSVDSIDIMRDSIIRFEDDQIAFLIRDSASKAMCYRPQFQFFSSAYAFQRSCTYLNLLLIPSYKLFLNKPFSFNGLDYPANTNILAIDEIHNQTIIDYKISGFSGCGVESNIIFDSSLVAQMEFDEELYEVRFTCMSSNNRSFEKKIEIYFK